jgi:hypothetical protein
MGTRGKPHTHTHKHRDEATSKVVELSNGEMGGIWEITKKNPVAGARYSEAVAKLSES